MDDTSEFAIRKRWAGAVTSGETGFVAVPSLLLRSQARLGLTCVEVVVLANILMHWWKMSEWPYPRLSVIANRMTASSRTVQRAVQNLEDKGLMKRLPSEPLTTGRVVRRFDLSGLVERLRILREEHEGQEEQLDTAA